MGAVEGLQLLAELFHFVRRHLNGKLDGARLEIITGKVGKEG